MTRSLKTRIRILQPAAVARTAALTMAVTLMGCATSNPVLIYDSPDAKVGGFSNTSTLASILSGTAVETRPLHGPSTDVHSFGTGWDDDFTGFNGGTRAGLDRTLRVVAWHCDGEIPADVMASLSGRPLEPGAPTSACRDAALAAVRNMHDEKTSFSERRHDRGKAIGLVAGAITCALAPPMGCVALSVGGAIGGLSTAPERGSS